MLASLWAAKAQSALLAVNGLSDETELVQMYDAISIDTIPKNAQFLAGYLDINGYYGPGWIANYTALKDMFPGVPVVSIRTKPQSQVQAQVADCETNDYTPQSVAQWASDQVKAGHTPTIYVETSQRALVAANLADLGLAFAVGGPVMCWRAWWNGIDEVLPGDVALQYHSIKFNYDTSCALRSWCAFPQPLPPPPPNPKEIEDFMFIRNPGPNPVGPVAKGGICLCSPAGAVNLGADWPTIVQDYAELNIPLVVHELPATLATCIAISYKPYKPPTA